MVDDCTSCTLPSTSVWQRLREFFIVREKYVLEWKMLVYIAGASVLLGLVTIGLYWMLWRKDPLFLAKRGWWLFYLVVTIVSNAGALWHFKAHKAAVSSMTGMMIGMTIGMQSGIMLSVVIGSTNGMFMGGLLGMAYGLGLGIYAGRCCGLMGIIQGAMAGVMGGTMGPMIALMMRNDHILWFMPPFMAINVLILLALSFFVFEEIVEKAERPEKKPASFVKFMGYCVVTTLLFLMVIAYGPKSAFVI